MGGYVVLLLMMTLCVTACAPGGKAGKADGRQTDSVTAVTGGFTYPEVPVMITDPVEKRKYVVRHYWDGFDFGDTLTVGDRNISEEAFARQIGMLMEFGTDETLTSESMDNLCSGMEKYAYSRRVFMDMADNYLYNPNSPYYNERIYLAYLQRMLESLFTNEAEKSRLVFRRDLVGRNMPGTAATDFHYYLENGERRSLVDTKTKGDYLLLVFYAPGCQSCKETMDAMVGDRLLDEAVRRGRLAVLAVYTEGDEKEWKESCNELPDAWIKGNDRREVLDNALYDLKATPSLYLLDSRKKVVLKDAPYGEIRKVALIR